MKKKNFLKTQVRSASILALTLLTIVLILPGMGSASQAPTAISGNPIGSTFLIDNQTTVDATFPAVEYNSQRQEYLVVWMNDRSGNDDIQAQRVSKKGARLGNSFYVSGGSGYERWFPEVAYNSTNNDYLVVWIHYNQTTTLCSLRGGIVPAAGGPPSAESVIETDVSCPLDSERIALAYNSTDNKYLVVWNEVGAGTSDILGRMVSSSGASTGSQIAIYLDPGGNKAYYPALAYNRNRNEYLVVWSQSVSPTDANIFARRLTGNGALLFPASIDISTTASAELYPAVAAIRTSPGQGQYLVTWANQATLFNRDIWAQRVNGNGITDGPPIDISSAPQDQTEPAIAGNNSSREYLVAWQHADPPSNYYIRGRAFPLLGIFPSEGDNLGGVKARRVSAAAGPGGDFLAVYQDKAPGASLWDIWGRLWGNRLYLPLVVQ